MHVEGWEKMFTSEFHFFAKSVFVVAVKNTNDGRTSKRSDYEYAKKCQSFQGKCEIVHGNF